MLHKNFAQAQRQFESMEPPEDNFDLDEAWHRIAERWISAGDVEDLLNSVYQCNSILQLMVDGNLEMVQRHRLMSSLRELTAMAKQLDAQVEAEYLKQEQQYRSNLNKPVDE